MRRAEALELPTSPRRARLAAVPRRTGEFFDNYLDPDRAHSSAYDEMFAPDGTVRGPYRALHESIAGLDVGDLTARAEALERALVDQGITFSLSGQERPLPLDLVPRVVAAAEWSKLEKGVIQRVRALEAFLADVYGEEIGRAHV